MLAAQINTYASFVERHPGLLPPKDIRENFRDNLKKMYTYRKRVLAIFDELVTNEKQRARLQ